MSRSLPHRDVAGIHACQIEEFGGSSGLLDLGRLDSALARPQCSCYGGVLEEAAAFWESLSKNRPFVDGIRRTSFAPMHVFPKINGTELTGGSTDAYSLIIGLKENGVFSMESLLGWLRENSSAVKPGALSQDSP